MSPLWAFPPTPMGRSGGQEGEMNLNPAPGWLTLGLSWWGAVGDKEGGAGGGGLSNSGGSLGEPVAPSSPAQAQDKPTSLGSTPPHSGTPGLSSPGRHGSGGPLAPVGGGRGTCCQGQASIGPAAGGPHMAPRALGSCPSPAPCTLRPRVPQPPHLWQLPAPKPDSQEGAERCGGGPGHAGWGGGRLPRAGLRATL